MHNALGAVTDSRRDPDRRARHLAQAVLGVDEDVAAELEASAGRVRGRGALAAAAAFLRRSVEPTPEPAAPAAQASAAQTAHQAGAVEKAMELLTLAATGPLDEVQPVRLMLLRQAHLADASRRARPRARSSAASSATSPERSSAPYNPSPSTRTSRTASRPLDINRSINNRRLRQDEPDDHGIGRSRDGLTTNSHALVDGRCRSSIIACTPGQAGDSPALPLLLAERRAPGPGPGRPRTTPDALLADEACSAPAHRQNVRSASTTAVIPEPADQIGHRRKRGSRGGRPVDFDADRYRGRNVVERDFSRLKNWSGLATHYDKHVVHYRGGMVLGPHLCGHEQ